jgi:hypothetical protein
LTADIYLRSLSPPAGVHDGQVALVERLSALSSAGRLSDLRVSVWGERFCLCDTCAGTSAGRAALERVEEFQRWADRYGAETSLPFERRDVHSNFAPSARESHEALVPPRVLLALYGGESLLGVFPHIAGEDSVSVRDGIDAIEAATTSDQESLSRP